MALNTSLILVIISTISVRDIVVHHENKKKNQLQTLVKKETVQRAVCTHRSGPAYSHRVAREQNKPRNIMGVCIGDGERAHSPELTYPPNEPVEEAGLGEADIVLLPEDGSSVP